jgi:hypothetical protein
MRDLHYHSCVQRALYLHLRPRGSGPLYVYTSPVRVQAAGGEIDCSLSRRCPVTWGTVRLRHAEVIREQVLSQKSVRKVKERVVRKKKTKSMKRTSRSEKWSRTHIHIHVRSVSSFPLLCLLDPFNSLEGERSSLRRKDRCKVLSL